MASQLTSLSFLSSSSSGGRNNIKVNNNNNTGGGGGGGGGGGKNGSGNNNNNNNNKSSSAAASIFLTPKVPFIGGGSGSGNGNAAGTNANGGNGSYGGGGGGGGGGGSGGIVIDTTPEFKFDDSQLAKEMNDLSVKERENRYEDLHGVSQLPVETPEFIGDLLQQLDLQLTKIPQSKRKWLDRAFFLKRSLETDVKFKLKFLRADRYNPTKAAQRMAAFFTSKVELFGEEKIVKHITLNDIDPVTVELSGKWRHVSNYRDQAGRRILALLPRYTPNGWKENLKFAWYQMYENLDDEETQIKGIVYVVAASDVQESPKNFIEYLCLGSQYLLTIPGRYNGFHFCHHHPAFKSVLAMLQYALGKDHRSRTRVHYGSVLETQYALSTFGIDKRVMPISPEGVFEMEAHERYLNQQRQKDANYELNERRLYEETRQIQYPRPQDVLVGRGRPFQEHIGNIRYLEVVDSNMIRYRQSKDRTTKSALFRDVIKYIHSNGGRFLQCSKDGHYWIEAPDSTAREKVSHSFRHRPLPTSSSASVTTGIEGGGGGGGEFSSGGGGGGGGGATRKTQQQQQQQNEQEPDFFSKRKRGLHQLLVPEQQISSTHMNHQNKKNNNMVFVASSSDDDQSMIQ